jgi:hypothetical protein
MDEKTYFSEILPVRLPVGAKQELALLAKSRYQSACAVARQAIMAEIEKAKRPRVILPSTVETLDAA